MDNRKRKRELWHPVVGVSQETGAPGTYSKKDIRAVQALGDFAEGRAENLSQSEAKRALDWIMYQAAMLREDPFAGPGQDDVRCYVLGKQSVAKAFYKLMTIRPEVLDGNEQNER